MKLTDKAKVDFEKYWITIFIGEKTNKLFKFFNITEIPVAIIFWNLLPYSMQYGVYIDFFDSVGLQLSIHCWDNNKYSFTTLKEGRYMRQYKLEVSSRHKARTKAIEKANEIYNEN